MIDVNTETQVCAVIGNPVAHSLSPLIHNTAFEAAQLNYVYVAFAVTDLPGFIAGVRAMEGFRGVSVTIPHKMTVMPYLDEIDPLAQRVGSVNTIIKDKGRLIGTTTDGLGTLRVFQEGGCSLQGKRVAFIGAGGAVRAVAFAMAEQSGLAALTVLGRRPERVAPLVQDLEAHYDFAISAGSLQEDLAGTLASHDVIIQGTPMGMFGHDETASPVPSDLLRPDHIVFDMVYRPLKTRLIREAEALGCRTLLGLDMLVNQAVLQFEAWTGVAAPKAMMRAALEEKLVTLAAAAERGIDED